MVRNSRLTYALLAAAVFASVQALASENVVLSCTYTQSREAALSPDSMRLTPRALTIDVEKATAAWSDIVVPAVITQTSVGFTYSGFEYAINRINGEIVFSNSTKLEKWRRYRAEMLASAQLSGRSDVVDQASRAVAESQSRDFAGVQHQGKCELSKDRKF